MIITPTSTLSQDEIKSFWEDKSSGMALFMTTVTQLQIEELDHIRLAQGSVGILPGNLPALFNNLCKDHHEVNNDKLVPISEHGVS